LNLVDENYIINIIKLVLSNAYVIKKLLV